MSNYQSISNAIKKFNVYTRPVSLLLLKEQGHRTYLGVFLTSILMRSFRIYKQNSKLTILVSLVVLVYYSGLESLIIRNNPSAISYTTYTEDQKSFYLTPLNFSIAIAQKGNDLMASYILEGSIGQIDDLTFQEIPMSKCTDFQFDDPALNAYFDKSDQIWYSS